MRVSKNIQQNPWYVYLLECQNGSLYTGATCDVRARFLSHLSGKGARYTRMHPPRCLRLVFKCASKQEALQLECAIKCYSAAQKRALCAKYSVAEPIDWYATYPLAHRKLPKGIAVIEK